MPASKRRGRWLLSGHKIPFDTLLDRFVITLSSLSNQTCLSGSGLATSETQFENPFLVPAGTASKASLCVSEVVVSRA